MKEKIFLILSFLCFFLPTNASQTFCTAHDGEINFIRNQAEEAIWQAHRFGHLFRPMVLGERDAAYRSVKYKSTYSEFSEVFHRFINISDPEGIHHLYEGYSKTTNLFLDLYNNCIKNHSNIGSKYERVNFGEFIGYHVDEKTGIATLTTCGEIRYSKSGVHIIPVLP